MYYSYDELCEESKENARNLLANSPTICEPWEREHEESLRSSIKAIEYATNLQKLIKQAKNYEFTGYCADAFLADYVKEYNIRKLKDIEINVLIDYFDVKWTKEIESRRSIDYIEEEIRLNEYQFSSSGETMI
jgi:hypothetical protein